MDPIAAVGWSPAAGSRHVFCYIIVCCFLLQLMAWLIVLIAAISILSCFITSVRLAALLPFQSKGDGVFLKCNIAYELFRFKLLSVLTQKWWNVESHLLNTPASPLVYISVCCGFGIAIMLEGCSVWYAVVSPAPRYLLCRVIMTRWYASCSFISWQPLADPSQQGQGMFSVILLFVASCYSEWLG